MAEGAIDNQNKPITSEQIKEVSVFDSHVSSVTCLEPGGGDVTGRGWIWHTALLF